MGTLCGFSVGCPSSDHCVPHVDDVEAQVLKVVEKILSAQVSGLR
jgi:hypothetical protein